jgi:hypothetical protein
LKEALSPSKSREQEPLDEAKEQIAELQAAQDRNIGIEHELVATGGRLSRSRRITRI